MDVEKKKKEKKKKVVNDAGIWLAGDSCSCYPVIPVRVSLAAVLESFAYTIVNFVRPSLNRRYAHKQPSRWFHPCVFPAWGVLQIPIPDCWGRSIAHPLPTSFAKYPLHACSVHALAGCPASETPCLRTRNLVRDICEHRPLFDGDSFPCVASNLVGDKMGWIGRLGYYNSGSYDGFGDVCCGSTSVITIPSQWRLQKHLGVTLTSICDGAWQLYCICSSSDFELLVGIGVFSHHWDVDCQSVACCFRSDAERLDSQDSRSRAMCQFQNHSGRSQWYEARHPGLEIQCLRIRSQMLTDNPPESLEVRM